MRGLCVSRAIPVLLIVIYLFSLLALPPGFTCLPKHGFNTRS